MVLCEISVGNHQPRLLFQCNVLFFSTFAVLGITPSHDPTSTPSRNTALCWKVPSPKHSLGDKSRGDLILKAIAGVFASFIDKVFSVPCTQ